MTSHVAGRPSDLEHSKRCAEMIAAYYKRLGITVRVWIEDTAVTRCSREAYPAVRSSLRMGLR